LVKKWVIAGGATWLLFIIAGLTFLVMKPRHVAAVDLKYLGADRSGPTGEMMITGEFRDGTTLAKVTWDLDGQTAMVRIFAKPSLGAKSDFAVLLPKGIATVLVQNPDGTSVDPAKDLEAPEAVRIAVP
jgi:hypothetical protein